MAINYRKSVFLGDWRAETVDNRLQTQIRRHFEL